MEMIKVNVNLVPDIKNPTPDYYCTWQTQLYASCDGKPEGQRAILGEKALFGREKGLGWAYFYESVRNDLFIVIDDGWDVPPSGDMSYIGSMVLNKEKFPNAVGNSENNAEAMKSLCERIKSLGWNGLGFWVCARESEHYNKGISQKEYWKKRIIDAADSGISYWKVDWGTYGGDKDFRNMLTELGRKYAANLVIEHAITTDVLPSCDVFRTYDVPAVMSIPMTMEKLSVLPYVGKPSERNMCLVNCEDEAYIAAAGGFSMGIMRHPFSGSFPNGNVDMSFPQVHRNLKTKMYEVIRAARWHRIAPAFAFDRSELTVSEERLSDVWTFENSHEEIENWWFDNPAVADCYDGKCLTKSAPAAIARNTKLPSVSCDSRTRKPFVVVSQNPNGVYSVATLGRTVEREYYIPKCDVTVFCGKSQTIGVFGEYKNLIIKTELTDIRKILIQDIADNTAFDITDSVKIDGKKITIPGELIEKVGTSVQPTDDTSEPGAVICLEIGDTDRS